MTATGASRTRAEQLNDVLDPVPFFALLRHAVGFREHAKVADPLQKAATQIGENPHMAQSRLLLRVLVALTTGAGAFRRAEVATLDSATIALVLALVDGQAAQSWSQDAWARAVEAANRASG